MSKVKIDEQTNNINFQIFLPALAASKFENKLIIICGF